MELTLLDVLEKTQEGPICKVKDWDFKIVPSKTALMLKEHGLDKVYDPNTPIPSDDGLADDFWEAGFRLALELGMFCPETERIVRFSEEELKAGLENRPCELDLGYGKDGVKIVTRRPDDERPITAAMSALGLAVSEEYYIPLCQAIAQYKVVDILLGCTFITIDGHKVRARTPYEVLAGKREAVYVKEAVRRAGRPGMALWGVEGAPTEYGQLGGYGVPGGFEPDRTIAICLIPEPAKLPYSILTRVAHAMNCGGPIEAGHMLNIGAYFGSPEGAAVGAIAVQILEAASMLPSVIESTILDASYSGNCGRAALWATSVADQARSRNTHVMDLGITSQVSGPCTDMLLYETAAISLADAVSGMAVEIGTRPAACRYPNYGSGLENKFCAEVLKGSAGMKRSDANEIVKAILPKYEDKLRNPPRGKSFPECTDLRTLKPIKEWQEIYDRIWRELEDMGLNRPP